MAEYDMTGSLYRNDYKTAENHPVWTGDCTLFGEKYKQAAWLKEEDGVAYMTIKYTRKEPTGKLDKDTLWSRMDKNTARSDDSPHDYEGSISKTEVTYTGTMGKTATGKSVCNFKYFGSAPVEESADVEDWTEDEIPF